MRVGVTRETAAGERRVALVPDSVGRLAQTGIGVVLEPGSGVDASYPDDEYREAGAELGPAWEADVPEDFRDRGRIILLLPQVLDQTFCLGS